MLVYQRVHFHRLLFLLTQTIDPLFCYLFLFKLGTSTYIHRKKKKSPHYPTLFTKQFPIPGSINNVPCFSQKKSPDYPGSQFQCPVPIWNLCSQSWDNNWDAVSKAVLSKTYHGWWTRPNFKGKIRWNVVILSGDIIGIQRWYHEHCMIMWESPDAMCTIPKWELFMPGFPTKNWDNLLKPSQLSKRSGHRAWNKAHRQVNWGSLF